MKAFIGRLLAKLPGNRAGFTLVEMLVVVAIIVALAAVIVPTVTIFLGRGEAAAREAEMEAVQTAIDSLMVSESLTSVGPLIDAGPPVVGTGQTEFTRDFRAVDFSPDASAVALLTQYMRDEVTQFCTPGTVTARSPVRLSQWALARLP